MFFSIFFPKKNSFSYGKAKFSSVCGGNVNLDKNGGLPAWRRGKAGKNWADGLGGLREAVCLAFKEAKKERKRGPAWRRGRTGKNWADGLREAVCLAFKEAKKERKSCLPAWRRGEVRKYYPENTIVFSG